MKKIIFGEPSIGREEINEVIQTLRSGWIGTGPKTIAFEKQFQNYVNSRHALAVSSCTAALHLSLIAAGVGVGDEVITTPLTFVATINAIWHTGARPILVDIDPRTLNIDCSLIERAITRKTKAILPVHFGGLPCDLAAIKKIAIRHRLHIIEDAAHAVGAVYRGKRIGSHGNLTCFSFYANKNITTAEGGMVTTSNGSYAKKIQILRLHGLSGDAWKRYRSKKLIKAQAIYPGFKYNMTDLQASLGIWQLKKLEHFLSVRERYARLYDAGFSRLPYLQFQHRPAAGETDRHGLHLYTIILRKGFFRRTRNEIVQRLRTKGIGAAIHYEAVHLQPFYRKQLPYRRGSLPNAEYVGSNIISLPLTPKMTTQDASRVIRETKNTLKEALRK